MQEQKLLKIEHNGMLLAFVALLAAIVIQTIIDIGSFRYIVGEWIVFMVLCIYMLASCLKNGIWDRRLKPNLKTNLLCSLLGGVTIFVVMFLAFYFFTDTLSTALLVACITGIITFALTIIALSAASAAYKKRVANIESNLDR